MDDIEPLDAFGSMGGLLAKYAVPAAGAAAAVIGLVVLLRSRGAGRLPSIAAHPAHGPFQPGLAPLVVQLMLPGASAGHGAPHAILAGTVAEQV
jgi:uncharacterized protein